jgi:hypothetical protein
LAHVTRLGDIFSSDKKILDAPNKISDNKIVKAMGERPKEIRKMQGSEKQINWANSIRKHFEEVRGNFKMTGPMGQDLIAEAGDFAKFWIEGRNAVYALKDGNQRRASKILMDAYGIVAQQYVMG